MPLEITEEEEEKDENLLLEHPTLPEPEPHQLPQQKKSFFIQFKVDPSKYVALFIATGIFLTVVIIIPVLLVFRDSEPELSLISQFRIQVSADSLRANMKKYSQVAHLAGTDKDFLQVNYTRTMFEKFGLKTDVEEIPLLLPYPLQRIVQLTNPFFYNCTLIEDIVNDETSGNANESWAQPWNGWTADGDVTGLLVYLNYGREEDFAAVESLDLTGKIVIMRYGKIFRGNKVYFAQSRGAIAVLLYSDPADYGEGPTYPEGKWANNGTIPRGSVWNGIGDPTTPGWGSQKGTSRITLEQARHSEFSADGATPLPSIPVQPISWRDAAVLLAQLEETDIPDPSWAGALPVTKIGPGPAKVHVSTKSSWDVTPVWNVIGRIDGVDDPATLIVLGAHRDAWTLGAGDPISATSVLLETARIFGLLMKQGWKPKRTIILASWDAEEYGMMGSTEFVENNFQQLTHHAAVYLNIDIAVSGSEVLGTDGSPSFFSILENVTREIEIKGANKTLYDIWTKEIESLGASSDYSSFFHHAGISSLDPFIFDRDEAYESVYHSNFDSFYWYSKFGDPEFAYHVAMTEMYGSLVLRFAEDQYIPLSAVDYGKALKSYVQQLVKIQTDLDLSLDFDPLLKSIERFSTAAFTLQNATKVIHADPFTISSVNTRLMLMERTFLVDTDLLPPMRQKYFKHIVFSPSLKNRYDSKPFPELYESISSKNTTASSFLIRRIAGIINSSTSFLSGTLYAQ